MVDLELRLDGRVVGKLQVDADVLRQFLSAAAAQLNAGETPGVDSAAKSATLTSSQASELLERVEKTSRKFLIRFTEEHGALTWGEAKTLFGLKDWDEFADGPLKKIEKQVHRLLDDKSARLIWRIEHEWLGLEKGGDEACRLHIDGPALEALKIAAATA